MSNIQKKIWALATVVLFIMATIWIALTYYNQKTQNQYNDILQRYLSMNEATSMSQQIVTSLNNYLLKPTNANLAQLEQSKKSITAIKYSIYQLRNRENEFTVTNYTNLIDSLIETSDRAVTFYKNQETEASATAFTEATRIATYISEMSLTLLDTDLKTYDRVYRGMIEQSSELKRLGIWLLLLITFLLLCVTYFFSLSITRPILLLTEAAKQLSKGRFDQKIEVHSNDEISFLAKMFNRMRINMNNLISEIQQNALLEAELQQNKLLLQESQLRSLQSQINPHFLFNTLDTLSKKAYLEGAEETSDLLVSVANMLRYNLKRLDKAVTLYDEVNVLKQYIDIQMARFSDRLQFHFHIDQSLLYVQLPGLTLQPIVENAVIHAIEPREDGGQIWFRIFELDRHVVVEIEDDGIGMSQQQMENIMSGVENSGQGHSTGIGFSNVIKRLQLFYNVDQVLTIEQGEQGGTKVVLHLPKVRSGEPHENTNRG